MTGRLKFHKIDDHWHVDKTCWNRKYNTEMCCGTTRMLEHISKGHSEVILWITQNAYHDHALSFYREKHETYLLRSSDLKIDRENVDLWNVYPNLEGERPEYFFADIVFPPTE